MPTSLGPLRYSGRIVFESVEDQQTYFERHGFVPVPAPGLLLRMVAKGVDDDGSELVMFMDRVRSTGWLGWNFNDYGVA